MGGSSSTLSIVLQLVDQASAQFQSATSSLTKSLDEIHDQANEVRNTFALMGGAIVGGLGVLVKQAADSATADMQLSTAIRAGIAAAQDDTGATDLLTKQKALLQSQLEAATGKIKDYNDKIAAGKDTSGAMAASVDTLQQKVSGLRDKLETLNNEQKLATQNTEEIMRKFEDAARAGVDYGFANDDTVKSLTTLFRATGDASESLKANQEAMDLARAKGIDLATAGTLIVQAMEGNGRALKQFGINLKDGLTPAEALDELQVKLANSAKDYVNTPWGQLDVAQAKLGLLAETLGASLLPALSKILETVTPAIQAFADWTAAHPKLTTAILGTAAAVGAFLLIIAALATAVSLATSAFTVAITVIGALAAAVAALSLPLIALGVLVGALAYIVLTHWKDIQLGTQVVWDAITSTIKTAIDYITGLVNGLWTTVMGVVNNIINAVNSAKSAIGGAASSVGSAVSSGIHAIVPHLAEGGIVTGPTLALVGEAGPEAVITLGQSGGLGTNINISITGNTISSQLDVRGIAKAVSDEIVKSLRLNTRIAV
jgi:hypothetical protein